MRAAILARARWHEVSPSSVKRLLSDELQSSSIVAHGIHAVNPARRSGIVGGRTAARRGRHFRAFDPWPELKSLPGGKTASLTTASLPVGLPASLHGIGVHVVELLQPLLLGPDVHVVSAALPHTMVSVMMHGWRQLEPGQHSRHHGKTTLRHNGRRIELAVHSDNFCIICEGLASALGRSAGDSGLPQSISAHSLTQKLLSSRPILAINGGVLRNILVYCTLCFRAIEVD